MKNCSSSLILDHDSATQNLCGHQTAPDEPHGCMAKNGTRPRPTDRGYTIYTNSNVFQETSHPKLFRELQLLGSWQMNQYHTPNATWWWCCGGGVVVVVLWLLCCGCCVVVVLLWLCCCGGVVVVWCGVGVLLCVVCCVLFRCFAPLQRV